MRGNLKSWLWVFAPFVLLLAFFLDLALPKKYSAAEVMSPDFMRDFIQEDLANMVFIGYSQDAGGRSWDYGLASFREYGDGYIFSVRDNCYPVDIPELVHDRVVTNYGVGSKEPQGFYQVFLSQAENLRQIKLYYKKDYRRDDRPDESWQLLEELAVDKCPALLIMPEVRPPEGSKCGSYLTYYAFLDENGEEIAFFRIEHSYDTYVG